MRNFREPLLATPSKVTISMSSRIIGLLDNKSYPPTKEHLEEVFRLSERCS